MMIVEAMSRACASMASYRACSLTLAMPELYTRKSQVHDC
jgi:hypothetical protein